MVSSLPLALTFLEVTRPLISPTRGIAVIAGSSLTVANVGGASRMISQ